ncbi:hypothetical protein FOG51_00463 [Hanseniaspora uvarum]|nr:hypothetical protein FOG51_00463 [Hanseniaspora uvarum]
MPPATLLSVELMVRKLSTPSTFPVISTVYYVATPELHGTSYLTTYWTGLTAATYSTSFTTYSGSDGKETVDTYYFIETPISRSLSTVYSFYDGSETTTISTTEETLTLNDEASPVIYTVYFVNTPEGHGQITRVKSWTGLETSTYDTSYTTFSGNDSKVTVDTFYFVETPIERVTITSFSYCHLYYLLCCYT